METFDRDSAAILKAIGSKVEKFLLLTFYWHFVDPLLTLY